MARVLNRPMFRRGGSANEGIMHGLVDRKGYKFGSVDRARELAPEYSKLLTELVPPPRDRSMSEMLVSGGLNLVSGRGAGSGLMANVARSFDEPSQRYFQSSRAAGDYERKLKLAGAQMGIKQAMEEATTEGDVSKYQTLANDLMRNEPDTYPNTMDGRQAAFKKAIEIYETSPEKSTEYWIKTFASKNIGQIGKRGKFPRAYAEYEHSLKPRLTKKGKDVGLIQDIVIKRGENAGKIDASLVEEGSYYYDLDKQTLQIFTDGQLVPVNPNTLEILSQ